MSDFYFTQLHQTKHAELVAQARQDDLARELPHRDGPLTRLLNRLTGHRTDRPQPRISQHTVRHA